MNRGFSRKALVRRPPPRSFFEESLLRAALEVARVKLPSPKSRLDSLPASAPCLPEEEAIAFKAAAAASW